MRKMNEIKTQGEILHVVTFLFFSSIFSITFFCTTPAPHDLSGTSPTRSSGSDMVVVMVPPYGSDGGGDGGGGDGDGGGLSLQKNKLLGSVSPSHYKVPPRSPLLTMPRKGREGKGREG